MKKILKILVIDDDTRLRNLLGKFLEENGFDRKKLYKQVTTYSKR